MNLRRKIQLGLVVVCALIGVAFFGGLYGATEVFAQGTDFGLSTTSEFAQTTELASTDIRIIIARIINVFLGILGIIAVGFILYAGFLWMTAGGDEAKIASAKKTIINSVIGLIIILSSFAITQFIINRLSEATGTGRRIPRECANLEYGTEQWELCRGPELPPGLPCELGFSGLCNADIFYVKSITPSTDETNMSNTVVKILFSRRIENGRDIEDIVEISRDGTDVTDQFTTQNFTADRKGLWLEYNVENLPPGTYTVTIAEDLLSGDDPARELEEPTFDGLTYPRETTFVIGTAFADVDDTELPLLSNLFITQTAQQPFTNNIEIAPLVRINDYIEITTDASDNTGVSVGTARLGQIESTENRVPESWSQFYDAPPTERGSDAPIGSEFRYSFPAFLASNVDVPALYRGQVNIWDIDQNIQVRNTYMIVVGEQCDPVTGAPINSITTGQCLSTDSCTYDWQCVSRRCDEERNICIQSPMITQVDPWDGGEGNWITVSGIFFGDEVGEVDFGVDDNDDGTPDRWVAAEQPAACEGDDIWNDGWLIVEVPSDSQVPVGSLSAIRVTRADAGTFDDPRDAEDTTINDYGPGPANEGFDGWFEKNSITRPGLCSVKGSVTADPQYFGSNQAPVETPVVATGVGFGQNPGTVWFASDVPAASTNWSDVLVDTEIPISLAPGRVGVQIQDAGGERSNGVPFTVLETAEDVRPLIEAIIPSETTRETFVTIQGQRFGSFLGEIWAAPTLEEVRNCARGTGDQANCVNLDASGFDQCPSTWSNREVIAYIPETIATGTFNVIIKTQGGLVTDGEDRLQIIDGPPRPSICSLDPRTGPSPLGSGHSGLDIGGLNFTANPEAHFWQQTADGGAPGSGDFSSWLSTSTFLSAADNAITTILPIREGRSMDSGPIYIQTVNGISNPVTYEVLDCRDNPGSKPGSNYRCCTDGAEAGVWKLETFACEGEPREAGYVWRFTSGQIPNIPSVVERCQEDDWFDPLVEIEQPSPIPWRNWNSGEDVCLNANIEVLFSMGMNTTLVPYSPNYTGSIYYPGNIQLKKCLDDFEDGFICNEDVPLDPENFDVFVGTIDTLVTIWNGTSENLEQNTWYRVILSDQIQGSDRVEIGGQLQTLYPFLKKQRPCGDGTAYCFEFKTGEAGDQCILQRAFIHPRYHTTNQLGDIKNIFNDILYFLVRGVADQACTILDVDGLGWVWGEENSSQVTAEVAPSSRFVDSRGQGYALQHTAPNTTDIFADVTLEDIERDGAVIDLDVRASSTITVNLGDPRVTDFWPNCIEACINAGIGARFNRVMDKNTYASGFTIRRCADGELCSPGAREVLPIGRTVSIDTALSDEQTLIANLPAAQYLDPNTWYVVTLDERIKSIGGYDPVGNILHGEPLEFFEWKFRTKPGTTPCIADRVNVSPLLYVEYIVGNKEGYRSLPQGSPDACSPFGQLLNPWSFDWLWSTEDETVASVSNFNYAGSNQPWCTQSCLPAGSTIPCDNCFDTTFVSTTLPAICGNGVVEAGEACDIGVAGELAGVSCTYTCLRPGTQGASCGDGVVDSNRGEQCDPDDANTTSVYLIDGVERVGPDGYCSETCTLSGSSQEATGDVNAPICGSGDVTPGEQCDINDPDTRAGCANNCLYRGTGLSRAYCDALPDPLNSQQALVCQSSQSICGNGILESGEECEVGLVGATSSTCSTSCLIIGDVCGTPLEQCSAGTPGCSILCAYSGSSLEHNVPSVCGDGFTGQGEYNSVQFGSCDLPGSGPVAGSPVQLVTAIGSSNDIDSVTQAMDTLISATIDGAITADGTIQDLTGVDEKQGDGEYFLQCGFTEFVEPIADKFNDCRADGYGVGSNTCCYPRPMRAREYPVDGAGIDIVTAPYQNGVCRNTYIEAVYDTVIDNETLNNNIFLAEWYEDPQYECPVGQQDVSRFGDNVILLTDLPYPVGQTKDEGFLQRIWNSIRNFFRGIIGSPAIADTDLGYTLCKSPVNVEASVSPIQIDGVAGSKIAIYVQSLLKSNQPYVLIIEGDTTGVKSERGVGVGSENGAVRHDGWMFQTGDEICKIDDVLVDPESMLYQIPFSAQAANAQAKTESGQFIVPIQDVYDWDWSWSPANNPLFDIPEIGTPSTTPSISIAARNLEGELSVYAEALVSTDLDSSNNHTGRSFSGRTDLYASFCENVWPARNTDDSWSPFEDTRYHFAFSYCADAGLTGNRDDDLPFFNYPIASGEGVGIFDEDEVLRRYVLFSEQNDDVITIQVLTNLDRLSIGQWYGQRFGNLSEMQNIQVDGYPALTDGTSYYVGAFNEQDSPDRVIYNQVYMFSVNAGAQQSTLEVLNQILDTVRFNTNIPEQNYCLPVGTTLVNGDVAPTEIACQTDFDCRNATGTAKVGTSGICGNGRTKFQRDLQRLDDIQQTQGAIETYLNNNRSYPALGGGTYFPGYTNSLWPSWQQTLSRDLGVSLPTDPINQWTQCPPGTDQQTCWDPIEGQYICPAFQSIYEYRIQEDGRYFVYGQLEYLSQSGPFPLSPGGGLFIQEFIEVANFWDGRWCSPGNVLSPFGEQCGDGVIQRNTGEVCELGQTQLVACGTGPDLGQQTQVCAQNCLGWVDQGQCRLNQFCGNGIVEGLEACDDGSALNGTYGHCALDCQSLHGQYCGNGILDFDDTNGNGTPDLGERVYEFCDANTEGLCVYVDEDTGEQIRPEVLIVLDRSQTMRACPEDNGIAACSDWSQSKWDQAIQALIQLQAEHGDTVDFYVQEVPGTNQSMCSLYHPSLESYLALNPSVSRSNNRVLGTGCDSPSGCLIDDSKFFLTPTTDAFMSINQNISGYFRRGSEMQYIFLITDGEVYPAPSGACSSSRDLMEGELSALRQRGIPTYVLSYINASWADDLDSFAQAAGTVDRENLDADYFQISDVDSLNETFNYILGCKPYSTTERGACALDCQGVGSFCGDGVVDTIYGEQCDDGNSNPNDGCLNSCRFPDEIPEAPQSEPIPGTCGDFIVNGDEVCDAGDPTIGGLNGVVPNPADIPYGEQRSYCANQCGELRFVDSALYCGNGVRDWVDLNGNGTRDPNEWVEACDAGGGGVTLDEFGNLEVSCDKWTTSPCSQGCQVYNPAQCIQCGVFSEDNVPAGVRSAYVNIELVHALTGRGISRTSATPFRNWTSGPNILDEMVISDAIGGSRSRYAWPGGLPSSISTDYNWWNYELNMDSTRRLKIVTEPICSDDYTVTFNDYQLSIPPYQLESSSRDPISFEVNGETGTLHLPVLYSPAIPDGGIRAVLYYPRRQGFPAGNLPTKPFFVQPGVYSSQFGEFLTAYNDRLVDTYFRSFTNIVYDTTRQAWVIDEVNSLNNTSGIKGSSGYFLESALSDGFVSTFTPLDVYLDDVSAQDRVAVYFTLLKNPREVTPVNLAQAIAAGVEVWVYLSREGQNGFYSTYQPDLRLPLSEAAVDASVDINAFLSSSDYYIWHLFNISYDGVNLEINRPVGGTASGRLIPDECSIRDGIPGDGCP